MQFSNVGSLELHGFARNRLWSVDNDPPPFTTNPINKVFIELIFKSTEDDLKTCPHSEICVEGLEMLEDGLPDAGNNLVELEVKKTWLSVDHMNQMLMIRKVDPTVDIEADEGDNYTHIPVRNRVR
ncbi:unnamed protein product [Lactuca saligna]|uniref:Glucose-6-phosphate 1-epimerase n=1 Tax=Lactuca saligna TaxID=75948 RepID=A0AA35Z2F2_LACSI|nr:unnamed protein product [Lactuca saligna]